MAIEYDPKSKLFQVDYQSPFGGVDSTAYASAIEPHNFADMAFGYVEDNLLKPVLVSILNTLFLNDGENYICYIPLNKYFLHSLTPATKIIGYVITSTRIISTVGNGTTVSFNTGGATTYTPALGGGGSGSKYLVINDIQTGQPVLYWTTDNWIEIWSFATATNTATLITNYIGGGYLGLLNNQLMVFGGVSNADGPVPNRISWSAPGQYGQFQPYDVGSGTGNYSAGFNDLPSTSDILTGFAAIGTVGYAFRSQGITQINPTGNGVQPFSFNHLWASELGIGAPYPYSISQYGSLVAFGSDSGIYTLGLGGLQEIGSQARTYIYNRINATARTGDDNFTFLTKGRIVPYVLNSPELTYILNYYDPVSAKWNFLAIGVNTGKVYNLGAVTSATVGNSNVDLAFVTSYLVSASANSNGSRQTNILAVLNGTTLGAVGVVEVGILTLNTGQPGIFAFRKEQMKFGYIPTINEVGFIASLIDDTIQGVIQISIDGGLTFGNTTGPSGETLGFPNIVIAASVANGIMQNVYSAGVTSLQRPQLCVKLTNVVIAEAWYQGTLADYPLIGK